MSDASQITSRFMIDYFQPLEKYGFDFSLFETDGDQKTDIVVMKAEYDSSSREDYEFKDDMKDLFNTEFYVDGYTDQLDNIVDAFNDWYAKNYRDMSGFQCEAVEATESDEEEFTEIKIRFVFSFSVSSSY